MAAAAAGQPVPGRDAHRFDAVPACLRKLRQWVCWRSELRDGARTKVPYIAIAPVRRASATDSSTWAGFDEAVETWQTDESIDGIGFVFAPDDAFCGVDLDDAIDEHGTVKPWAQAILARLNSYSEVSPSGAGIKVFIRARKPTLRCRSACADGEVEIYDSGRYFTVTGQRLDEFSAGAEERQVELEQVCTEVFGPEDNHVPPPPNVSTREYGQLADDEVIRLASTSRNGQKFIALWEGGTDGYASASEADSALICLLAFFTRDAVQLDRLFRRSGLFREKWDERRGEQTYGQLTIANALSVVSDQYVPRARPGLTFDEEGQPGDLPDDMGGLLGSVDSATGRLILSTERTLPTAVAYVRQFHLHPEGRTLHCYADLLFEWRGSHDVELEDGAIRKRILGWLHEALRMFYDLKKQEWVTRDFPANPRTVSAAVDSLKAHTHLPATTASPSWLGPVDRAPPPSEIVACRSGLLHVTTMTLLPSTPQFFALNALDYDYDPSAPRPSRWHQFLTEVFEDDLQSSELLQEWFGLCLTGDTAYQKMLLIVGPRRSGKGTIARVLRRLNHIS